MNGDINLTAQQRLFDLLDKNTLASNFDEGNILHDVALGFNDNDFHLHFRMLFLQSVRHPAGLRKRQSASPRADF